MEYLTTKELSRKWGISQRRIQVYCKEIRIDKAILKGNTWLIPENVKKPEDPRKHNINDSKRG